MAQNPDLLLASLVDASYYFQLHPEAASSGLSAVEHYLQSGWTLGYDPNPYFSTAGYLADNPDVARSGMNPLLHYAVFGATEGRSPSCLFDAVFYLAHNPDVVAAGVNPLLHFMQFGVHEGRDPNAYFSVSGYLAANPDVAAAGVDPYAHYLAYGWHEGRNPSPNFNTSWYLAQNPDVAAAGVNPLEHFLRYGLAEHRMPAEPELSVSTSSVAEGDAVTYLFHAPGQPAGTVYSYALSGVQAGDVSGPLTGTVTLDADGRAEITVTLVADGLTEGTETLHLTIGGRVGSVEVLDTSPQTQFFLTAGTDSISGSSYDDTITSTVAGGFGGADRIDGGDGTDLLIVTDTAGVSLAALPILSNVEQADITSTANPIQLDTTAWTGLEGLTVHGVGGGNLLTIGTDTVVVAEFSNIGTGMTTINGGMDISLALTGSTTGGVTIGNLTAPTGAISLSNTSVGAVAMGSIAVTGGTSVSIAQAATNAVNTTTTMGSVTVLGTAETTFVSVVAAAKAIASGSVAGVNPNSVAITDVNYGDANLAGTIASVGVANYTSLMIGDNALTTLSLRGGSGNIIIDNSGLTTPTNRTLDATVDGLTGGTLDDADIYTTLNVTTAGHNSTLSNITFGALTSLTLDGTKILTLNAATGMSALQTVTVGGAAGLTANLSNQNTVTSIDTSATTGTSTITLNAHLASFTGGAGADRVTFSANPVDHAASLGDGDDSLDLGSLATTPGAALSGGDGTDTLTMTAALAATASGSNSFAGMVTGFERLVLTGATNQTINLAVLGIPDYVSTRGGNGLTLSNLSSGGTLDLTGAGTAYTIGNTAFTAGADDLVHLVLRDGSGASVAFAATGITMGGVEHVDIQVQDSQATPTGTFNDFVTLLGNASHSITIAGNAGLNLTATSTGLTTVDASGITLGGFAWTSGALANAVDVHGSATGTNTVNLSAATQIVTYTGGSGDDTVTATNGRANVIDLGDGVNSYTGSGGNHTITAGDGNDSVVLTNGNNSVSLGNGSQ